MMKVLIQYMDLAAVNLSITRIWRVVDETPPEKITEAYFSKYSVTAAAAAIPGYSFDSEFKKYVTKKCTEEFRNNVLIPRFIVSDDASINQDFEIEFSEIKAI